MQASPPYKRLYRHAIESILAHLCLSDLVHISATCREWSAAVGSMRPIGATANVTNQPLVFHAISNSRLMRHVAHLYSCMVFSCPMTSLKPIITSEIAALCNIVKQSKFLVELNLAGNSIKEECTVALAKAIGQSVSLTKVWLRDNCMYTSGAFTIAEAIKQSKSLAEVDLSHNRLDVKGIYAISDAIKLSTSVIWIDLSWNALGDVGAVAVADAIKHSRSLAVVQLRSNEIGDVGAISIAEAIKQSTSLVELDLWNNKIGDKGLLAIAEAIKQSSSCCPLTEIEVGWNSSSNVSMSAIAEALELKRSNP